MASSKPKAGISRELEILPTLLVEKHKSAVPRNLVKLFASLRESPLSTRSFSFYTSVSAIASSKIEGEKLEVDSFIKHRMLKVEYLPDLVQKPDDLYSTYRFAQKRPLNRNNFLQAHKKLAAHLLPAKTRGALRKTEMVVMQHKTNRIQFEAAPARQVPHLFDLLWKDIGGLLRRKMDQAEIFYFASCLHLVFVCIHPFEDGNGRAGRLLEKWFLAEKLGPKAWFLQSELYYYRNVNAYYKNLASLGFFYERLDYSKALPFLLMLPKALKLK